MRHIFSTKVPPRAIVGVALHDTGLIVERNKPDGGEGVLALTIDACQPVYRDKLASAAAGWLRPTS